VKVNTFPTDIFHPNYRQYPAMRHVTVYDGMLAANEMIFIPAASAHQVQNMAGEPTVGKRNVTASFGRYFFSRFSLTFDIHL
jgi:hypothetical protein